MYSTAQKINKTPVTWSWLPGLGSLVLVFHECQLFIYCVHRKKISFKYYVMKLNFASKHKSIIFHDHTCHYQYNALHSALIGSELFCWWVNFHAPLAQAVWFEEHKLVSTVHKKKFIPKPLQNLLYFTLSIFWTDQYKGERCRQAIQPLLKQQPMKYWTLTWGLTTTLGTPCPTLFDKCAGFFNVSC